MKRPTLTLAILCAFAALTYAGPEQLPEQHSGKEMKAVVQPVAPACPDFGGFYIGAFGGYKFTDSDIDLDLGGDWPVIPGFEDLQAANSRDVDLDGPEVGGIIGYNFQFNKLVVGIEASGAYTWLDDSNSFDGVVALNTYSGHASLDSNYLITVGPRIGYAFCNWLPYVTGGVAFSEIDFHQEFFIPGSIFGQSGSAEEDKVGWMVGGGLEYAITNHWRIRAQYQYIDLGSVDFNSVFVDAPDFTGEHEAELKEHNVTAAIIFGF